MSRRSISRTIFPTPNCGSPKRPGTTSTSNDARSGLRKYWIFWRGAASKHNRRLRRETMKLHWEPITLDLKTTFRVAHGASDQRHNVLVYLDEGVGEAATVPYYGETREGIIEYLKSVPDLGDDPFDLDAVLSTRP